MNGRSINYISLSEAAKLTSYSQEYISLLCRQKKLKGTKIGRNWVTTKEWVRDYIDRTKGKGQNVITVKIKSAEDTELNSEASEFNSVSFLAENTPVGDSIPPFMGKLILATIICSLFVSSFIFLQLGFQKGAIKINPSQAVKGTSVNIAEGIISISDSLDMIKSESARFAINKIISLDNSLSIIGNTANKKSANEMAEVSESQNDSNSSVLAPIKSITDKNNLSSGGPAGNRTPETLMLKQSSSHSEPTANLLYQINSEKSKLARGIIFLSGSLDLIKNGSAEFAAGKIIAFDRSLKNASDGGKELSIFGAQLRSFGVELRKCAKSNSGEFFGGYSKRIENNLENLAEPLRTKLARLSRSKDIIFAAVFGGTNINKSEQGRVAGVSDENIIDLSSQKSEARQKSNTFSSGIFQKIITLSNSLDIIKNKTVSLAKNSYNKTADKLGDGYLALLRFLLPGYGDTRFAQNIGERSSGENRETGDLQTDFIQENESDEEPTGQISNAGEQTLARLQNRVNKLEQEIKDKEVITITQTLKGERGGAGEKGEAGSAGPAGEKGLAGEQGPIGLIGPPGVGNVTVVPSSPVNTNTWSGSNVFSGFGSFESLGVAYDLSAGRSLGVGGSTTLGSDSSNALIVNATSTFNNPITLSNAATLTTGTGQVTFGGNVDASNGMDITTGNLTVGGTNFTVDPITGNITTAGDITAAGDFTSNDVNVLGNLTVSGAQTYSGAAAFTSNSTAPALLVNQQGTGNIVQFQDNGVNSFVIADGGQITIAGNVGIGTSTPSQKLHVEGQCVTGDTLLPIISAKEFSIFNFQSISNESIFKR